MTWQNGQVIIYISFLFLFFLFLFGLTIQGKSIGKCYITNIIYHGYISGYHSVTLHDKVT